MFAEDAMEKRTPDERIVKLSYAKFEEEFGFKPASKTEQKYFALKGRRPSQAVLSFLERGEALKSAMAKEV